MRRSLPRRSTSSSRAPMRDRSSRSASASHVPIRIWASAAMKGASVWRKTCCSSNVRCTMRGQHAASKANVYWPVRETGGSLRWGSAGGRLDGGLQPRRTGRSKICGHGGGEAGPVDACAAPEASSVCVAHWKKSPHKMSWMPPNGR